jgi:hypothetical protein
MRTGSTAWLLTRATLVALLIHLVGTAELRQQYPQLADGCLFRVNEQEHL